MPEENTNTNGNTSAEGAQGEGQQAQEELTWEKHLETLPEDVRNLYNTHITGLKNTVSATREDNKKLTGELRDAAAKAEKGSEAEAKLTEMADRAEKAEQRAQFIEDAANPEIGCTNPRAALAIAQASDLFDRRGNPSWEAIKKAAPELFRKAVGNANAGSGTGTEATGKVDMNAMIRQAAGRQ